MADQPKPRERCVLARTKLEFPARNMPVSPSLEQVDAHRERSLLQLPSLASNLGSRSRSSGGCRFNSLDAQRESCEAYVASQKPEGWVLRGPLFCQVTVFNASDAGYGPRPIRSVKIRVTLIRIERQSLAGDWCPRAWSRSQVVRRRVRAFPWALVKWIAHHRRRRTTSGLGKRAASVQPCRERRNGPM